jgi:hypothetical protein
MERLAHRPELRFEPGRLGPGNTERIRSRGGLQPQKSGASGCGAKTADRPGRVKAEIVMPGLQCRTDTAGSLIPSDKSRNKLTPGGAFELG